MLNDLKLVTQAVTMLQSAMGVTDSVFKDMLTRNGAMTVDLKRGTTDNKPGDPREAETGHDGDYSHTTITLWGGVFKKNDVRSITHELAHAWDYASKGALSTYLAYTSKPFWPWQRPDRGPTTYGDQNQEEDWAETVAVTVLNGKTADRTMDKIHQDIMHIYVPHGSPIP